MEILRAVGITKSFGDLAVLKGVSLSVKAGEIVAITGKSGAGKSTLLHALGTLDKPDSGTIEISGVDITTLKGNALASFRNKHLGFVFQFHHLLPEFSALENVSMPAFLAGVKKKDALMEGERLLTYFGLADRLDHKPTQLSGGEQQRVAVARALINKPDLILADEPTGNLDQSNSSDLMGLFKNLQAEYGHTFVIVTHSQELAVQSDRQIAIVDGIIQA